MPKLISDPSLSQKLSKVRLIVTDVDGVLTDGKAYYDETGLKMKAFSMRDGFGFVMARFAEIDLAVITGNVAELVKRRLEAFNITRIKGGHFRKTGYFQEILTETGMNAEETIYIGDDLFDLPVMRLAGVSAAPADAHSEVLAEVDGVTRAIGGNGALREVVEAVVRAKGLWENVLTKIESDEAGGRG